MRGNTKILLQEYKKEFKEYDKFIRSNDWIHTVEYNPKTDKKTSKLFDTQAAMVKTITKSLDKFIKEVDTDIQLKPVRDFFGNTAKTLNYFISTIEKYNKENPITEESNEVDFEFKSKIFTLKTEIKGNIYSLQLDDDIDYGSIDIFRDNVKAPLTMRKELYDSMSIVREKIDQLNIDFDSDVVNKFNADKMFIDIPEKDIPKWDENKHFFEQDEKTLRFWEQELIKCRKGLDLGGYYMSGWLYFHINHFMLNYGEGDEKSYKPASFRDNEWYIDETYKRAQQHGRCGIFLYGSRRISKSVTMTSRLIHTGMIVRDAKLAIQVFTKDPDLKAIYDYTEGHLLNARPALSLPLLKMNIDSGIEMGIRGKKTTDIYTKASVIFINLESGNTRRGSQKTAGSTPDFFLIDEFGKGDGVKPWNAAIPSFEGGKNGRWRVSPPWLSGTPGEEELSIHAEKVLKNPKAYKVLEMDWDLLDSMVEPEYRTWTRDTFATFVPGQMSLAGPDKIKIKFSKFLKTKLNIDVDIYVTDWKAAKEFFENERKEASKDLAVLASKIISHPLTPDDCYVSTKQNKFPANEAKFRKQFIISNGLTGQKVRFNRNALGEITPQQVNEPLIEEYPFQGGTFDAPIVMLDDPYNDSKNPPPLGLYCMGFDDVKHDKSSGDSIISATIVKRSYEGSEWANRIVAYYDSRPEKREYYYKQLYMLMKYYNCRILNENDDNGFLDWVERNHISDVSLHFSESAGLASSENFSRNQNRKYGWSSSGNNVYLLESRLVAYCQTNNFVCNGVEGLTGIDMINHPMLLEELTKYKPGRNADRIRSWGLAVTLAQYYDKTHQFMKTRTRKSTPEDEYVFKKEKRMVTSNGLPIYEGLNRWSSIDDW